MKGSASPKHLRYATGISDLGTLLVASSDKGIVAVLIGADRAEVLEDFKRRFPRCHCASDEMKLKPFVRQVAAYIHDPANTIDFPLDPRGTAFQKEVWKVVRNIPMGETMTYTEVASKAGHSRAIRAVGNACTINHLAFAIPCHRVLHKNRGLSFGHMRGNDRMRPMVARESEAMSR